MWYMGKIVRGAEMSLALSADVMLVEVLPVCVAFRFPMGAMTTIAASTDGTAALFAAMIQ